ncbi:putative metal-binding motif-containing protein [Hyalangium sp.]|uniref:putative metal-binding motif-containing protein n=1 Tax=Hyalangium sp. TaxID=2028555 RepID=UPI0039C85697
MRHLWFCGLCFILVACRESAPADGAVRVHVKYDSHVPRCIRVSASDDRGNTGAVDIPQKEFKNKEEKEVRVAVFRKREWGRELTIEVTSREASDAENCSDRPEEVLEQHHSPGPITVPLKDFATFVVKLQAQDRDGDGHVLKAVGVEGTDCDDTSASIHPGVPEVCGGIVDRDCDGQPGCEDTDCTGKTCDDGNGCTENDRCEAVGAAHQCQGTPKACGPPNFTCYSSESACNPDTGECVLTQLPAGTSCDDQNRCTTNDQCGLDAACAGTVPVLCNTPPNSSCFVSLGVCDAATGTCSYEPQGPEVSCDDSDACTQEDKCSGSGECKGEALPPCEPPNDCHLSTRKGCPGSGACTDEVDPLRVNKPCTIDAENSGVCRPDGYCSSFPFTPSNFDPDAIPADKRKLDVRISCVTPTTPVIFNSSNGVWTFPQGCTRPVLPETRIIPQEEGEIALVSMQNLIIEPGNALKLKGDRAVILAVYGDAILSGALLADADLEVTGAGSNRPTCGSQKGGNGSFSQGRGSGGGGGAFGQGGAKGGKGEGNSSGGVAGTKVDSRLSPLIGGCQGGTGGAKPGMTSDGKGGAGGGALQMAVAGTLHVNHWVSVSGGGGLGGDGSSNGGENAEGGGGGGSGGGLLLEAFRLQLTSQARLTANAGSGAEGGDSDDNSNGSDGSDGSQFSKDPAAGGTSGGKGAPGGHGGANDVGAVDGVDGALWGGAGGGGGGVGIIRLQGFGGCVIDSTCGSTDGNGCDISPRVTPICD